MQDHLPFSDIVRFLFIMTLAVIGFDAIASTDTALAPIATEDEAIKVTRNCLSADLLITLEEDQKEKWSAELGSDGKWYVTIAPMSNSPTNAATCSGDVRTYKIDSRLRICPEGYMALLCEPQPVSRPR